MYLRHIARIDIYVVQSHLVLHYPQDHLRMGPGRPWLPANWDINLLCDTELIVCGWRSVLTVSTIWEGLRGYRQGWRALWNFGIVLGWTPHLYSPDSSIIE